MVVLNRNCWYSRLRVRTKIKPAHRRELEANLQSEFGNAREAFSEEN
jgi:hypothetical protein